jgi:hypothetical protein
MSLPRVPAFQPRPEAERTEAKRAALEGSRVDVLAKPLAPVYGNEERRGGQQQQAGAQGDAEDQLARLLAGADSKQIRAWAGNISANNARKAREFFPDSSPLKYIGPYASAATYHSLTLSEVNRRRFGAYVPWTPNQGGDMTPLAGNRIIVAGEPFSLRQGVVHAEASLKAYIRGDPRKEAKAYLQEQRGRITKRRRRKEGEEESGSV